MTATVAEMRDRQFKDTVRYLLIAELSMKDNSEGLALEICRLIKIKC